MTGTVGVLNVGAGDTKFVFDKANPAECIRAARIVKDMLQRGYALLVDVGEGKYQRVYDFDEAKFEYIIADLDPEAAHSEVRGGDIEPRAAPRESEPAVPTRGRGRRGLDATSTGAIAVGRTAGG